MSPKNNSSKKQQKQQTSRKDFTNNYPPLFKKIDKRLNRSSASPVSDKKSKRKSSDDIPEILKNNIAALSDSTDSIKLTEFGKSFIEVEDFSSPPKKKMSFFDNFLSNDAKSSEKASSNFENKRLLSLRNESKHVGLLSSPSMMNTKMSPPSPVNKFPQIDSKNELSANEAFEKLKKDDLNESKIIKDDEVIQQKEQPSQIPKPKNDEKDTKKSVSDEENLGSSSESNKPFKFTFPDFGGRVITDYKESLNNFKHMVSGIKRLNDKILAYRQELSETMKCDFPSTQGDNP